MPDAERLHVRSIGPRPSFGCSVRQRRPRGRSSRQDDLRRREQQQATCWKQQVAAWRSSTTTTTAGSTFSWSTDALRSTLAKGAAADQPPLQEQSGRHIHRRHRKGRPRAAPDGAKACCIGDYDNDGNDDLFVTYWGDCALYHNNGNGTFTDVAEKAGVTTRPQQRKAALEHRLRFPGLRPRWPPGSVRRQLHRFRSEDCPAAGIGTLPIQGLDGGLRAARARRRQEYSVSQQRRRHIHRCLRKSRHPENGRDLRARRAGRRLR